MIQKAKVLRQAEAHWNLGCDASLMAMRFAKEGAEVLLGAQMSKNLHKRLDPEIQLSDHDSFLDEDDVHLILEYQSGETWGQFTAPRANRYILHSDNVNLQVFHNFNLALPSFNPRLMIISGLQVLDNQPSVTDTRETLLKQIQVQLRNLPRSTLIHFEMGSYSEPIFLNQILDDVISYIDSVGMNEQELVNLQSILEHQIISPASENNPQVATTLDQLRTVFIYFHDRHRKNRSKGRQVTRLHLHTLAYQIIMRVKSFGWRNTRQSAAKASLRASKHVCGTQTLNPGSFSILMDNEFSTSRNSPVKKIQMKEKEVVSCWTEILRTGYESVEVEFCVVPNLVCTNAIQTAGAGDHISAAGLILQI